MRHYTDKENAEVRINVQAFYVDDENYIATACGHYFSITHCCPLYLSPRIMLIKPLITIRK